MRKVAVLLIPFAVLCLLFFGARWFSTSPSAAAQVAPETAAQPMPDQKDGPITISGTVRGPGGPVSGVSLQVFSPASGWVTVTSGAGGFYSVNVIAIGHPITFKLRPPLSSHLAQLNYSAEGLGADATINFDLLEGSLLSVLPVGIGGQPVTTGILHQVLPLATEPKPLYWYELEWDTTSQRFQAVLPKDIIWIKFYQLPEGYFPTFVPLDIRSGDLTQDIPLNTHAVPLLPVDAPDVSRISLGAPDDLGQVLVTGAPGSVGPLSMVFLNNLNSLHQAYTTSAADGSFSVHIYAPPGSNLLIKYGPAMPEWNGLSIGLPGGKVTLLPGTILYIPPAPTDAPGELSFAAVGAANKYVDLLADTRDFVGAAFAVQGVMQPLDVDTYLVTGTMRLYSPAITASTSLSGVQVSGDIQLRKLFEADGQQIAHKNRFLSTVLTPSGLPIEMMALSDLGLNQHVQVTGWRHAGEHALEGDLNFTFVITDAPPGIYRPVVEFPQFEVAPPVVPTSTQWLASEVGTYQGFSYDASLPPITVGEVAQPRLIWRMFTNNWVQGQRGIGALQDQGQFGLVTEILTQGDVYYLPPYDERTGEPITYTLQPFLPLISYADRKQPGAPTIPFSLPGGELYVHVRKPDGQQVFLGPEAFTQSLNRTPSTVAGTDHNLGTQQPDDFYALQTSSDTFDFVFDQYGLHVITMTGMLQDVWGNNYIGGGTYEVWVAHPLDIDPGVLPGAPLAVGDAFNPSLQVYPAVPAQINLTMSFYDDWQPTQVLSQHVQGQANPFGFFSPPTPPLVWSQHGEYRVDLTARYTDPSGKLYMGAMTWGGVVMTPPAQAQLAAHGRRGYDVGLHPDMAWFVSKRDVTLPEGSVSHLHAPYFPGDMVWSRFEDGRYGDSLILNAGLQDLTGGVWSSLMWQRAQRMNFEAVPANDMQTRFARGEIPVFFSTTSGKPTVLFPGELDQVAYTYEYSQRPGVRVREYVAEDNVLAYWRLDTTYDDQLGDGIQGDIQNDFKFQFLGVVYHDLAGGHSEYLGYASSWVFLPDSDPLGSRVMPPFAGTGNGGWTTEGGPIITLQGEDIDIFILPTGVQPGAVLTLGDRFRFAGHINPTLNSQVAITVTAPGGAQHFGGGQANPIGYFYDPADDFEVDEPGLWSVDVKVWHDGYCSGGHTIAPYPQGDVLGSDDGRYWFYVVQGDAPRLNVASPTPGYLHFNDQVTPITVTGQLPPGLTGISVDYTIRMPGFILEHGQADLIGGAYQFVFDPVTLAQDFPNLDLVSRGEQVPGLSDTFAIDILLTGQRGAETVQRANAIILQGQQVYVDSPPPEASLPLLFLPVIVR
jgi:hypothetical protein